MKIASALLLLSALAAPGVASAAETAWSEVMPGARLRLISAGSDLSGRALIGLELELDLGFKTYWRVPGETGLPTELSVTAGGAPVDNEILWPLPERDNSQGYVDYVYSGHIVLPVLIDAKADAELSVGIRMGLCSDICVPVMETLDLPGASSADAGNGLRLRQAVNDTPIPWAEDPPPLVDIAFNEETGTVSLAFDPERIDPNRVFPSLDGTTEVFGTPEINAATGRLSFPLLARSGDSGWRGKPLRLTFATREGPYDIVQMP